MVEDDEAHAEIIRRVFEEESPEFSFNHVASINGAIKWLEFYTSLNPPLVISDYNLPDGNGLELTKGAASPEEVGFPLIILTGVGSEKLAVRTLRSGALDYVVKSNGELHQLPKIAKYVLREWDLIMERKYAENELKDFINDLDEANTQLEDFLDGVSKDLEESITSIRNFSKILQEKYADKLDEAALSDLKKVEDATERTNKLLDKLFEYVVPIYFDSSLIEIYNTKLNMLNRNDLLAKIKN
ncbi:MAG: response regulator [Methanotrichaceae archaeon]|nr:response regulator [Methanotrichaceae archaeon]